MLVRRSPARKYPPYTSHRTALRDSPMLYDGNSLTFTSFLRRRRPAAGRKLPSCHNFNESLRYLQEALLLIEQETGVVE